MASLTKGVMKYMSLKNSAKTHENRKRALASTKVWCLDKNGNMVVKVALDAKITAIGDNFMDIEFQGESYKEIKMEDL